MPPSRLVREASGSSPITEAFIITEAIDSPTAPYRHRRSLSSSLSTRNSKGLRGAMRCVGLGRRSLGILLLLCTVFLWTGSNFLASAIFADDSYSKPYFVTYLNTSFFAFSLLPIFLRIAHRHGYQHIKSKAVTFWRGRLNKYHAITRKFGEEENLESSTSSDTRLLEDDEQIDEQEESRLTKASEDILTVRETARLSLEFCLLWFIANYLVAACLTFTSVASSTILTSTSSIWTLLFGALLKVEKFSVRKLIGVLASLAGIILISSVDLSGDNDKNRGSFPHKSQRQIAIGDSMAFLSALMYGVYAVVMKKRIGNEDRVNMPLFFGLVGLFNAIFLWPGFFVLHFTGVEVFELPPTEKIWWIVLANSASSFLSDYCWAYAMLLTTPLVVTVGLSLTIPLSLIGQMILQEQYSSALYWVGACIVFLSFLFVNHESRDNDDPPAGHNETVQPAAVAQR